MHLVDCVVKKASKQAQPFSQFQYLRRRRRRRRMSHQTSL